MKGINMEIILLQIATDSLDMLSIVNSTSFQTSIWFWLASIEFLIILFLILKLKRTNTNLEFSDVTKENIKKSQKTEIDMDNLMNSINASRDLYKELSSKCHPDRFINTDKQDLADKIFQEISANKRNYQKLIELRHKAIEKLNITY